MGDRRAVTADVGNLPTLARRGAFDAAFVGMKLGGSSVKTLDGGAEAFLKVEAAHFAVGQHVEADAFLKRDCVAHGPILELLKFIGGKRALVEFLTGVLQILRTQKAADNVGASGFEIGHDKTPLNGTLVL